MVDITKKANIQYCIPQMLKIVSNAIKNCLVSIQQLKEFFFYTSN